MKEKLVIKNFGPIENVELELRRFNVLIGENSTGKSTVAKVLVSIYSYLESIVATVAGPMSISELNDVYHFKNHLSVY
ncbi:MAG TPA: AAA family ATPase, partial [Segetibacter sp.]